MSGALPSVQSAYCEAAAGVLERISDAVILCDRDGVITLMNRAACDLLRCAPGSANGEPLSRRFPDNFSDLLSAGGARECVVLAVPASGSAVRLRAIASRSSDGSIGITLRPAAQERATPTDSERLAAIVESSDDAIISKTLGGIISTWNRSAERLYGYTADEVVGRHVGVLIPADRVAEESGILHRIRAGERIDHFETVRLTKAGQRIDVSLTVSPIIDSFGTVVGASKIARDITDRRRADAAREQIEQRMRLAIEALRIGFWDWDLQNEQITRTPRLAQMLDLPVEQLQASAARAGNIHPDDRPAMEQALEHSRQTGQDYTQIFRTLQPDGSVRWMESRAKITVDANGSPSRMLGIVVDISDRKLAEEATRQHDAEVAHLSRISTMGNMAAGLAHELNQPLGAILNYAGVCRMLAEAMPGAPQDFFTALDAVVDEMRRADAIISRLRAFVSKRVPQRARADLNQVIGRALALLDYELRHQRVSVVRVFAEGLPAVRVDQIQIEQVVVNLVYNAMQAMQAVEPADRRLTVATQSDVSAMVRVTVADTGPGMKPEQLARLFEPFYTTKPQGMGMGLNISRSIVESHGGRLHAEVNSAGGMTFRFTLPTQ